MRRPAQRLTRKHLTRILACAAAVPVIFAASGCSSDSGSGDDGAGSKASSSASGGDDAASNVKKAAYAKLPEPCTVLSKKTLGDLVPKADDKAGKTGKSEDISTRGTCSWNSLDNNGVKGSQFRWLNVSLLRFESDAARGSGDKLAQKYYAKQVKEAQSVDGAKNAKTEPVSGTGDAATSVRYDLKKDEGTFKQQTVVTRVENVVVTIDYNGAGLAGEKTPSADDLAKDAQRAAKEAVSAVVAANQAGGASDSPSGSSGSSKDAKGSDSSKSKKGSDSSKKS